MEKANKKSFQMALSSLVNLNTLNKNEVRLLLWCSICFGADLIFPGMKNKSALKQLPQHNKLLNSSEHNNKYRAKPKTKHETDSAI